MTSPIACNLGALSTEQRQREQQLLSDFIQARPAAEPTSQGYRFEVPGDPATLARLGELLALERVCCPFLSFDLAVPSGGGPVTLDVYGDDSASRDFIRTTFLK